MCQDYQRDQCGPDPMRNSTAKAHPVPTRILNKMDKEENKWENKKKCECRICKQHDHGICPNIFQS